jgi:glycosyltransferase involved in cell wall biosynthesis
MNAPVPALSIDLVICTYNNSAILDRALSAISRQEVPPGINWKCLIVDNNCTDDTAKVVDKHIRSGRIPFLRAVSEPKQGLTPARRCGVENTSAEWIAFIDDDCLLKETWVHSAAAFAASHDDCGAFGGRVILDWEKPPPPYVRKYGYSFAEQNFDAEQKETSFLVGAGLVVRRAALLASGWCHQQLLSDRIGIKLNSGGDVEIVLRIRSKGFKLWYVPECKLLHVIPSSRTSLKYLVNINFGLGTSQLYADAMVWPGTYHDWIMMSARDLLRSLVMSLRQIIKVMKGSLKWVELAISLSFLAGRCVGWLNILCMKNRKSRTLLGCAKQ